MAPVLLWILLSLVAAAFVLVIAGATGNRDGGLRQFVTDLRNRRDGGDDPDEPGFFAAVRQEVVRNDEGSTVEDLFVIGRTDESAYLTPHDVTEPVTRAARVLTHPSRR